MARIQTGLATLTLALALGNGRAGAFETNALADTFSAARQRMVKEQLQAPERGIQDQRVLSAMATVQRHEFVPEESRRLAYGDHPLPIGYNQTISQPYVVAFMTEQLRSKATDRILE